jgi:predicted ArsR family transcriptional regulator
MSEHTRGSILEYLIKYHTATAAELSGVFHFTKENIRHHLNILLSEGLIEVLANSQPNKPNPGRPSLVYHISLESQPGNTAHLATSLLSIYLESFQSDQEIQAGFKKLAQKLFPPFHQNQKPAQVYNKAIQLLNQHGYQARWEAHHGGPLFSFENCPYAAVDLEKPVLCLLDKLILENILGSPVGQITKMNFKGKNPPTCIFSLNEFVA